MAGMFSYMYIVYFLTFQSKTNISQYVQLYTFYNKIVIKQYGQVY